MYQDKRLTCLKEENEETAAEEEKIDMFKEMQKLFNKVDEVENDEKDSFDNELDVFKMIHDSIEANDWHSPEEIMQQLGYVNIDMPCKHPG
eukprot:Awhi_evm1s14540